MEYIKLNLATKLLSLYFYRVKYTHWNNTREPLVTALKQDIVGLFYEKY